MREKGVEEGTAAAPRVARPFGTQSDSQGRAACRDAVWRPAEMPVTPGGSQGRLAARGPLGRSTAAPGDAHFVGSATLGQTTTKKKHNNNYYYNKNTHTHTDTHQ